MQPDKPKFKGANIAYFMGCCSILQHPLKNAYRVKL